ncbi:hypothetical protein [Kineosporia sp. NBRC 101731]|uniref:hypothetical protein n=1 Tax=Kineosporia sp. NBRC 101731 TaxID=3032199 RepID=UPI0024A60465|nr:hypothetical protein [Kineosporia sp. NBRC 101731]GLY30043.1 hypothetical protein Kisp02_34080 [Kineosporia sp. NBRC 101731]
MQTLDLEPGSADPPADPPSTPLRLALYVLGVVGVLLLGSVVVGRTENGVRRLDSLPTPSFTRIQLDALPVSLRETCPVRTDHRNHLTVSFTLANTTSSSVLVEDLDGLARGGLRQERRVSAGGSCELPAHRPVKAAVAPKKTRLYTVRWKLPDTCPERSPLRVEVSYRQAGDGQTRSGVVIVLDSLRGIGFVQCPHVVTEFPGVEG